MADAAKHPLAPLRCGWALLASSRLLNPRRVLVPTRLHRSGRRPWLPSTPSIRASSGSVRRPAPSQRRWTWRSARCNVLVSGSVEGVMTAIVTTTLSADEPGGARAAS